MRSRTPNSIINSNVPLITDPKGLDALVQTIQIGISQRIDWLDKVYGQAETGGQKRGGNDFIYPKVWQGKGKDMLNVLPNDTLNAYGFFVVRDPESVDGYDQTVDNWYEAECDFIAWFNLDELPQRDTFDHMYRENLIIDLQNAIQATILPYYGNIAIDRIYRKPEEIFQGFTIDWVENQRLQEPNMGVRINMTIRYLNDECGLGAEVPNIVCGPATAVVKDQDGNILATENIPSGESKDININTGGSSNVLYTYPYDSFNTGQDISYAQGDDKWVRDNVFNPEINSWDSNLIPVVPRLDQNDPTKLAFGCNPDGSGNNIFNNKERFTDTLGGQDYANGLVLDHYLGLMITNSFVISGSYKSSIFINAQNYSNSGYSDFFIPNNNQHSFLQSSNQSLFNTYIFLTSNGICFSSSTDIDNKSAILIDTKRNQILRGSNTDVYNAFLCRKAFTYNPITEQMELS